MCPYCQKPGHVARRCDLNPQRNSRGSCCRKNGHVVENCWICEASTFSSSILARAKLKSETELEKNKSKISVIILTETNADDGMAALKRTEGGQAVPSTWRESTSVRIPAFLGPIQSPGVP